VGNRRPGKKIRKYSMVKNCGSQIRMAPDARGLREAYRARITASSPAAFQKVIAGQPSAGDGSGSQADAFIEQMTPRQKGTDPHPQATPSRSTNGSRSTSIPCPLGGTDWRRLAGWPIIYSSFLIHLHSLFLNAAGRGRLIKRVMRDEGMRRGEGGGKNLRTPAAAGATRLSRSIRRCTLGEKEKRKGKSPLGLGDIAADRPRRRTFVIFFYNSPGCPALQVRHRSAACGRKDEVSAFRSLWANAHDIHVN